MSILLTNIDLSIIEKNNNQYLQFTYDLTDEGASFLNYEEPPSSSGYIPPGKEIQLYFRVEVGDFGDPDYSSIPYYKSFKLDNSIERVFSDDSELLNNGARSYN